jgi:hypothetical protein
MPYVLFYPLRDGIHDGGLDLEAIQASRSHDPRARDHGHQLHKLTRRSTTSGLLPTLYDAPERPGDDDEGHGRVHVAHDIWRTTTVPTVPPRPAQ